MTAVPIKNYSTKVPAERSIHAILKCLRLAGAQSIQWEYDQLGRHSGLAFQLPSQSFGTVQFRLPLALPALERALRDQATRGVISMRTVADSTQVERVALRLLLDWLRMQLALTAGGLLTFEQAWFGYLMANEAGQTTYESSKE